MAPDKLAHHHLWPRNFRDALALDVPKIDRDRQLARCNPLGCINHAAGPIAGTFRSEQWIGIYLESGVLVHVAVVRSRHESEARESKQGNKSWFAEAFAPRTANGQLLIERLPAHTHFGNECVGVIILPIFKTRRCAELQRMESRHAHRRGEDWNQGFPIERILSAAGM